MFDQILSLVKTQLENHPQVAAAVPAAQAADVHKEVAGSIVDSLQQNLGGGLGNLSELFSGGGFSNIAASISGGLVGQLTNKFNLDPAIANNIAAAIPGILAQFGQQHGAPTNNEQPNGGLGGMLGGLFNQ